MAAAEASLLALCHACFLDCCGRRGRISCCRSVARRRFGPRPAALPGRAAMGRCTNFTVSSDDPGASVEVARGLVAVESKMTRRTTTVTVGQTASIKPGQDIALSGTGTMPPIFGDGTPIAPVDVTALPAAGYP